MSQLIAKCWADEDFKKALISNPRSAVEKEFGITLPGSVSVQVVEESSDNFYLVLPQKNIAAERGELSNLELEAVASGKAGTMGNKQRNGAEHLAPE